MSGSRSTGVRRTATGSGGARRSGRSSGGSTSSSGAGTSSGGYAPDVARGAERSSSERTTPEAETLVIWEENPAPSALCAVAPLLLGEAPSKAGDRYNSFPLSGRVSRTLCELAETPPEEGGSTYGRWYWPLREQFSVGNVISRYPAAYPWSVPRARDAWTRWLVNDNMQEGNPIVVVCLGRRVADAVGIKRSGWGGWLFEGLLATVVIPHPSGLNRALNDPGVRGRAGATLAEARLYAAEGHPDWRA